MGVGRWSALGLLARAFSGNTPGAVRIVLLNLAVVAVMMIPSFRFMCFPGFRPSWGRLTTPLADNARGDWNRHRTRGNCTSWLSAGTSVLPRRNFRVTKYKASMRTVLVLWWVVILLGLATYTRWYVRIYFDNESRRLEEAFHCRDDGRNKALEIWSTIDGMHELE